MLLDVDARANVAEERAIAGKSRNSGIVNPTICVVASAEPVLHSEIFTGIEVAGVNLYTALKVVTMHSFRPAVAQLLGQATASKCQPRSVKPYASLVCARHPYHDRRSIHHLTESCIKFAGRHQLNHFPNAASTDLFARS